VPIVPISLHRFKLKETAQSDDKGEQGWWYGWNTPDSGQKALDAPLPPVGTLVMDPVVLKQRKATIAARAVIFVQFWISLCAAHNLKDPDFNWHDFPLNKAFVHLFLASPEAVLTGVICDCITDEACYLLGLSNEEMANFDPRSLRQLPRISATDNYWGVYVDLLEEIRTGEVTTHVGAATRASDSKGRRAWGLFNRLWTYLRRVGKFFHHSLVNDQRYQPSFHILADMRQHEAKHRIYCHLLEGFFMFMTPAFDEKYRADPNSDSWFVCPVSVPKAVKKLRSELGVSVMSNFPGANHASPLKQLVRKDYRFTGNPNHSFAKCHNSEADCDGGACRNQPWKSIDGSFWDLTKLICWNCHQIRQRSGWWRDQATVDRLRMRRQQSDIDHCGWCHVTYGDSKGPTSRSSYSQNSTLPCVRDATGITENMDS
jgi:hypothetical protein